MTIRRSLFSFLLLIIFAGVLPAQETDREAFTIEGSIGAWWIRPAGHVLSNGTIVDLRSDLGMSSKHARPLLRATLKPTRKNRLVFETVPYKFEGNQALTRSFTFNNVTYTVQDRIASRADVNYVFGGYQRDLISTGMGHGGVLGGVAYLDGDASVRSETRGLSGTESARLPFPLIGGEFRVFPGPGGHLNVNGEVKGLPLGGYGHYIHTAIHAGISFGTHITAQVGYSYLNADVHEKNNGDGFKLDFRGPVISIQFRDR
jgi:hypothetical protein